MSVSSKRLNDKLDNFSYQKKGKRTVESGSRQSFLGDLEGKKHVFDNDIFSPIRLKQSCIMSLIS